MKTVVVTGASTGIGRATAIEFAKNGDNVLLVARNGEKLDKVKEEIEMLGGKAEVFIADLSSPDGVERLIEDLRSRYSEINILCNIAGIWHGEAEVFVGKNPDSS